MGPKAGSMHERIKEHDRDIRLARGLRRGLCIMHERIKEHDRDIRLARGLRRGLCMNRLRDTIETYCLHGA